MTVIENLSESISLLEKAPHLNDPHFVLRANFKLLDAKERISMTKKIEKPKLAKRVQPVKPKLKPIKPEPPIADMESPTESKEISLMRIKLAKTESDHAASRAAFKKSKHTKTGLHSERATELYAASLIRVERIRREALDMGVVSR